jgi:tetratricopeptide (TPR) repeat protein
VHHLGGDASSVYAYSDELDAWLRKRNGSVPDACTPKRTGSSLTPRGEKQDCSAAPDERRGFGTAQQEAAELVACARRLWEALSSSNLSTIAGLYRRATDLDPSNAVAFAGLSQALIAQAVLGNLHPAGAFRAAEAALKRALEIEPELFEAVCASAMMKVFVERDWEGAALLLDHAARSGPKASQAAVGQAFLAIAGGRLGEAREILRGAARERPLNTSIAELLCWVEYLHGGFGAALGLVADARGSGHRGAVLDTVEALCGVALMSEESQIGRLEAITASSPRNYTLLGVLGYAYGKTGRQAEARRAIDSMSQVGLTGVYEFAYPIALTHLGIGENEEAQRWVEQSFRHGSLWSLGFGSDPMLSGLRSEAKGSAFFGRDNYPLSGLDLSDGWVASPRVAD